mmetsp:Transcript_65770/g.208170  ORF Transcript_65770/g.208170 Transcript_65770/m.208170 type:complete len:315 (+) Transcript_65770:130-1074(+)
MAENPFKNAATRDLIGHRKKIQSIGWNREGTRLASGSKDMSVRIWNVEDTKKISDRSELELKGHGDAVDVLAWDPKSSDRLATSGGDRSVRLWDIRAGKCAQVIETSGDANINIAWSPDGQLLAVGNRDDVVSFIDVRQHRVVKTTKFGYEVNELAWKGKHVYLATGAGTLEVVMYPSMERVRSVSAHTSGVYSIAFDAQGKHFALGSADSLASLWDRHDFVCLKTFSSMEWPIRSVSFSNCGAFLASAGQEERVDISHCETGAKVHSIPLNGVCNVLAWNPKHPILAYLEFDLAQQRAANESVRLIVGGSSAR